MTILSDNTVMQGRPEINMKFVYICLKVFQFHIFQKRRTNWNLKICGAPFYKTVFSSKGLLFQIDSLLVEDGWHFLDRSEKCRWGKNDKNEDDWILKRYIIVSHPTQVKSTLVCFNSFPHIDAFWRLCNWRLFKNIVTKEEIAQN